MFVFSSAIRVRLHDDSGSVYSIIILCLNQCNLLIHLKWPLGIRTAATIFLSAFLTTIGEFVIPLSANKDVSTEMCARWQFS